MITCSPPAMPEITPATQEGGQLGVGGGHGGRVGGALVVAGGDHDAGRARLAQPVGDEDRQAEEDQAREVHRAALGEVEALEQQRPADVGGDEVGEVVEVQDVLVERDRERQRGDGEEQARGCAAPAARRRATRARRPSPAATSTRNMSRFQVLDQVAGHQRADADDGELAEADVAAPPGEDHEADRRQRPHDRDRREVEVRRRPRDRDEDEGQHDEADDHPPAPLHLGEVAQLDRAWA